MELYMEVVNKAAGIVVIIPSPGMGHLIPLIHFSNLLLTRSPFSLSLLIPSAARPGPAHASLLVSLHPSITHTFLPPFDPTRLPAGASPEVTITATVAHSIPSIRAELGALARRARIVALVTDLFGTELFHLAREMGIPPYMYFTTNATCLLFLCHLPKLDKTVTCQYRDMHEPLALPGCVPLHGKDFVDPVQNRNDLAYRVILDHVERYSLADGIFVNTFSDVESGAITSLHDDHNLPRVYPIGPIIQSGQPRDSTGSDCLKWLEQQPSGSVLFVSFGSGGTLSTKQLNELAVGLEMSGKRFIWVVRSPNDQTSGGTFFGDQTKDDPFGFLPPGFVNRVKDRGLLVPSWAPQVKILGHESTGGFLTHCGWNSILESIVNGVPLIAWPLYAEQKMNAVMLSQGLHVALRPEVNENGVVEAHQIENVVKELMEGGEGKRVRERMKELSDKAKRAMGENGESRKILSEVVDKWIIQTQTQSQAN